MERALKIVVTTSIVLIVLVIFVPKLICACSRRASNDSAAVANLRTINTAEITYKFMSSSGGTFGSMTDLIAANLLDDTFTGTKWGYKYSITLDATGSVYTAEATPASAKTGSYGYYTVPDAIVRYSTNASLAPARQAGRWVQ
jgi:hypothetical protein